MTKADGSLNPSVEPSVSTNCSQPSGKRRPLTANAGSSTMLRGFRFREWWKLLRLVNFSVDAQYWGQALQTTLVSLNISRTARREQQRYGEQIAAAQVQQPIFIIGHWRSGTTLLHTLLTQATRSRESGGLNLAFPNLLQVSMPHNFMLAEPYAEAALQRAQAVRRQMDNLEVTYRSPGEGESALALLSLRSPMLGQMFPRHRAFFDRYLTFAQATEQESNEWRQAMLFFNKKLSLRYPHSRLMQKSPQDTARIRMILELFPDARFIHLHRDPYLVFRSTQKLLKTAAADTRLQAVDRAGGELFDEDSWILQRYRELYDAYLEQRGLIPPGQLVELAFADLEQDMQQGKLTQVERIFKELGLPDFDLVQPQLQAHVDSLSGYRKNTHAELPADLRQRVRQAAGRIFETWGYQE